ncbi:MAG: lipid-A-disaccharide synthase [Nitrospiraceae bacterium]|jgi:lipid-A-disaccharide synthase|nr:lipid-A-disaccharide synthase [Nitrospiraceae bacterium]
MNNGMPLQRVMIIAGESSGEMYGALLANVLRAEWPGIDICGIGGVKMETAGVRLLSRIASSFGALEAVRSLRQLRRTYHTVLETLAAERPQVLVLIDYPDFNMKIAPRAKALGIPVFYYVSPQVWAWRSGRIRTMKKIADFIALILPFEESLYRAEQVPCAFVGHPVMDEIRQRLAALGLSEYDIGSVELKHAARNALGIPAADPALVVMPGSRHHEITTLLPVLVETLHGLRMKHPEYDYVVPVAPNLHHSVRDLLQTTLEQEVPGQVRIVDDSLLALCAADCGIIASGTSTFQAAMLGVPHVVIYRLSPVTFWIARRIIKVNYISLANILLDTLGAEASAFRSLELLQKDVSAGNILGEVLRLMDDPEHRNDCLQQYRLVRNLFLGKEATKTVAGHIAAIAHAVPSGERS